MDEELNVTSVIKDFFNENTFTYSTGTFKLLTYFTEIDDSTMELRVHEKFDWDSIKAAYEFKMFPSNIHILDQLCSFFNKV